MAVNASTIPTDLPIGASSLEYPEFRVTKISLYVLIFILSFIGNSLVAIVILGAKGMRTPANLLILNLALCDLITPALSIPFDLALEEMNYVWPFGRAICKVLWPFQTAFSTSSSLTLAAISLDRLRTLVNPFAGRISTKRIFMIVSTIHVFSICLCIPYFIALDYSDSENSCDESWSSFGYRQAYTIVLFLSQYALPLITMSVSYLLIYRSLRENMERLFSTDPQRRQSYKRQSSTISEKSMEFKRKEQNIRLAKMFVLVVVVFAISMFPNQVLWLWVDFGNGADNKFFHHISVVCRLFTYANSVLNAFIYALKNREFRSGFARIGRTTMKPLRKISHDTRKFVRKVSRNVLDSPNPVTVPLKPVVGHVDISEELSTTVEPQHSPESSYISLTARKRTRKYSCCEIQGVRLSFNSVAELGWTPLQSGAVRHSWEGAGHRDEIANKNCFNGIKFENNQLKNTSTNDTGMIPETLITSRLHSLFEELPETDC